MAAPPAAPRPLNPVEWLCVGLGVLAAAALLLNVLWEVAMGLRSLDWPVASGRIVAADMDDADCRRGKARLDLRYRFQVGGRDYEGRHASFLRDTCESKEAVRTAVSAMPVGSAVRVRHHPDDPGEAVLDGLAFDGATAAKALMAALVWLGLIAAFIQRRRRHRQAQRSEARQAPRRAPRATRRRR